MNPQIENPKMYTYNNYEIFIENVHFIKMTNLFKQYVVYYVNERRHTYTYNK